MNHSDFNITHQSQNTASKIVASLERIAQAFRVLLWQESKEYALSPIQVQVLIFLLHHSSEKRKVSYLADEFNMSKATISDTIKTLEQKSLIFKEYTSHDNRSYTIRLSPEGKNLADKTSYFTQGIYQPVDLLQQEDKEQLLLSLLHIIRHLNASGIISIQRMCLTCMYYESSLQGRKHFCKLLNQELQVTDLRVDCPEYQIQAGTT